MIKKLNKNIAPALHPTLAALFYVLEKEEDLSEIGRNHRKIRKNKFYQPLAYFPDDISNMLPDGDCWWEPLGTSLLACLFLVLMMLCSCRGS